MKTFPPRGQRALADINGIVLHESAGNGGIEQAKKYLAAKGYGVHVMIGRDPVEHDMVQDFEDVLWHAPGNRVTIGMEVLWPYYPSANAGSGTVIQADWAHKGQYLVPAVAQMEETWQCVKAAAAFIGKRPVFHPGDGFRTSGVSIAPGSGEILVASHAELKRSTHADGRWPRVYCTHRAHGSDPAEAYRQMMATHGKQTLPAMVVSSIRTPRVQTEVAEKRISTHEAFLQLKLAEES